MNIIIGKHELNTVIGQFTSGFVKVRLDSLVNGEMLIELGMKVLIKQITYKIKLNDFAVANNTITAKLEGVPDPLLNYAKEKGLLKVKGLQISKGAVSFDPGELIPPFATLSSIVIENDQIDLKVSLG